MALVDFQQLRINALEQEIERLNNELKLVKDLAFKVRLSDPMYNKPLSEIEINFEIVNPNK